jgi:hypothetical protein
MSCAACGYLQDDHDWPSGRCPLCACGALPAEHEGAETHCPGKLPNEAGRRPSLRRGKFRPAPPPIALVPRADGSYVPAPPPVEEDAPVGAPPLVPARYTAAESEIAPRAMPLGTLAADLGWKVEPWYWQAADGAEMSVLVMQRDDLRAVAYWSREPGGTWKTAGARAWKLGNWPVEVGVTALIALIEGMGRS